MPVLRKLPAVVLAGCYFAALWRWNDHAHLAVSCLFLLGLVALKRIRPSQRIDDVNRGAEEAPKSNWRHRLIAATGGTVWLAAVITLVRLACQPEGAAQDILNSPRAMAGIRMAPFVGGLGLAGWSSTRCRGCYGPVWRSRELRLLFFLGVPSVLASWFVDLSPATARFAEWALQFAGFEVQRNGLVLALPGGAVRVYEGCSGKEAMCYLLGLSVLCLTVFPTRRRHYVWLPAVAMAVGFVTNGVRVVLMAVLAARHDEAAFDYWHQGDGSLMFGMISVTILGLIYTLLLAAARTRKSAATA